MDNTFGQRLLGILKKQGITQKEFAKRVGTTESSISRYISGSRKPGSDTLVNIAVALRTTSDYLLGLDPDVVNFDFQNVKQSLSENSAKLSEKQKLALISALFE